MVGRGAIERAVFVAKLNRWVNTLKVKVLADRQQAWKRPPKGRVLVLAPHPDDEAIGCGGAIALHRRQNDPVCVVWLYDLTPVRRAEAERTAKTLGFNGYFGQGHLKKLLPEADILYLPGLVENNLDHMRVHELVVQILKIENSRRLVSRIDCKLKILLYEVWGPLLPNRLLTIDPVIGVKEQAIQAYRSQLKERDYLAAAISLNRYRGTSLAAGKFAEAFLELSVRSYLAYWQDLH